jgi:type II secretory pathway pseudopilin PulG
MAKAANLLWAIGLLKLNRQNKDCMKNLRKLYAFSLLELLVVIVLLAGLFAIAIPSIRSLGGLDLKSQIIKIAGLTSEVYALAAISGKTHRIVFDLDTQKYWVEEKASDVGEIMPELGYEDLFKERQGKNNEPADRFVPSFKEVSGDLGEKFELDKNLVIHGVWTEDMTDIARTGKARIYFFSGGYTEVAFISLAIKGEENDSSMYLSLEPLTGEVAIDYGEPDTSKLMIGEGQAEP